MQPAQRRQSTGCMGMLGCSAIFVFLLTMVTIGSLWVFTEHTPFSAFSAYSASVAAEEITASITASLAEDPHLRPDSSPTDYPIDRSVPDAFVAPLEKAFDYMRATDDGARLFDELLANDVLVSVESIPYNAGYTNTSWTRSGWRSSEIVIADEAVRTRSVDVLAAILIHESAHVDRAISGDACFYTNSCETLSNGIEVQEEEFAHTVEAQFWLEMYGSNGKSTATGTATGENALLKAYNKGTAAFDAYIREIRSDSREGEGVGG
ncbi:hypothetical protein BH09CHL1_BH09CHL1_01390 [soil metagenome]